jgi:hypothetical protein
MANEFRYLEISEGLDLAALADEVQRTGDAYILRRNGEKVAVLKPALPDEEKQYKNWRPSEEDIALALSAAGSWAHVDADRLIADIYAARRGCLPPSEP